MKFPPPTDEQLRNQFGSHVEIRRKPPTAAEMAEDKTWLELAESLFGYQKWMLKSKRGMIVAVIVVPAAISGHIEFWKPHVELAYGYAKPYISMVREVGLQLSDELVIFGDASASSHNHSNKENPLAFIVPRPLVAATENLFRAPPTFERTLWRITSPRFDPLDGTAVARLGGRWSSAGPLLLYTAEDPLGALEEFSRASGIIPFGDFQLHELAVMGTVEYVPEELLRRDQLGDVSATRAYGDDWIATGRTSALAVRSAIDPSRRNFILNLAASGLNIAIKRSQLIKPAQLGL